MKRSWIYLIVVSAAFALGVAAYSALDILKPSKSSPGIAVPQSGQIPPSPPSEESRAEFNPTGCFEFAHQPSKGFRNIKWISINTALARRKPEKPKGMVLLEDKENFDWRAESIDGDMISFATGERMGVSYRFAGQFLQRGVYEDTKPSGVVLAGRLTKVLNGRSVLEEDVELRWFSWGDVEWGSLNRIKQTH
jgi:hypothetical protein